MLSSPRRSLGPVLDGRLCVQLCRKCLSQVTLGSCEQIWSTNFKTKYHAISPLRTINRNMRSGTSFFLASLLVPMQNAMDFRLTLSWPSALLIAPSSSARSRTAAAHIGQTITWLPQQWMPNHVLETKKLLAVLGDLTTWIFWILRRKTWQNSNLTWIWLGFISLHHVLPSLYGVLISFYTVVAGVGEVLLWLFEGLTSSPPIFRNHLLLRQHKHSNDALEHVCLVYYVPSFHPKSPGKRLVGKHRTWREENPTDGLHGLRKPPKSSWHKVKTKSPGNGVRFQERHKTKICFNFQQVYQCIWISQFTRTFGMAIDQTHHPK